VNGLASRLQPVRVYQIVSRFNSQVEVGRIALRHRLSCFLHRSGPLWKIAVKKFKVHSQDGEKVEQKRGQESKARGEQGIFLRRESFFLSSLRTSPAQHGLSRSRWTLIRSLFCYSTAKPSSTHRTPWNRRRAPGWTTLVWYRGQSQQSFKRSTLRNAPYPLRNLAPGSSRLRF
jgi:hypothetical protein